MRAARHEQWGSPLEIGEVARPEPAAGEVRIAVQATSVNPIDMHTGRHAGYEQSMRLPCIPGWDVAGVVDAVGYGVTRYTVGERLYGLAWFPYPAGTYAEYMTVPAYHLVPMPRSASFAEAACLPMAALTAWQMLDAVEARAGRHILVSGASGGVGHLAVQLAVARGATVTALARPGHHPALHNLGAHTCVDYTDPEAVTAVGKVDAVLDLVGHGFGASLFDRVTPGGTIALATAWSIKGYRAAAEERGIRAASCLVEPDPVALTAIAELVDSGAVRVVVGAEFDLSHAADAQRWVEDRRGFGKAAIVVNTQDRT
ncbi:NADP-dependent oxidoreductase [Nocardia barduliensis]|uniref:NADP-dependent oxidoreductase n=1 Tax=Nocardia barduliensis TaxID=2736643 RepID=UPI001C2DD814|nr:NADP-dependent oxidoreductase [Nocardia barduliensis]